MNNLNVEKLSGILRHVLTFVGGILVFKGILDESTLNEISGGIVTLLGTIWSVVQKNKLEA